MAFFPRTIYNSDASFTPLFRLLDDFDKYSQGGSSSTGRRSPIPTWQPRFDVRETDTAYELHGELPGMTKDQVSIEFPEAQTLTVRGRTERTYTSGTPPAGHLEDAEKPTITEGSSRRNSHQATVEDEAESNDAVVVENPESEKAVEKTPEQPAAAATADKAKYWLTERSIGEFSRTFNFPSRIEPEAVSANLKDGVLSVVVPKAKKYESRRIAIQ